MEAAANNNRISEVISRLRAQAQELWPEAPPNDFSIVRQWVRPYSNVYRLELISPSSRSSPSRFIYAKLLAPSAKSQADPEKYLTRLATEFSAGRRLHEALQHAEHFAVIKPVAYYPDLLAVISEEAPGKSLADLIAHHGKLWPSPSKLKQLTQHCRRAGHALAAIQQATAEASRFDPNDLLQYIDVRLHRLSENKQAPFATGDRRQILRFLESAIPTIPAEQLKLSGSHSDYAPFNLLAATDKITVADFTMFKVGSVYNDLTYFCHRLEGYLHKPIFRAPTIRRLQDEFLRGYVESSAGAKKEWRVAEDVLFKIFWIKHVVNNYSAIVRGRVMIRKGKTSLPAQLFNRHVFRRYNRWMHEIITQTARLEA